MFSCKSVNIVYSIWNTAAARFNSNRFHSCKLVNFSQSYALHLLACLWANLQAKEQHFSNQQHRLNFTWPLDMSTLTWTMIVCFQLVAAFLHQPWIMLTEHPWFSEPTGSPLPSIGWKLFLRPCVHYSEVFDFGSGGEGDMLHVGDCTKQTSMEPRSKGHTG